MQSTYIFVGSQILLGKVQQYEKNKNKSGGRGEGGIAICSSALECVGANSTKDEMPADTFNFTQPTSLPMTVAFQIARRVSSIYGENGKILNVNENK